MIADLKPYPAMKDSGLPWCPEVPEHWELKPNRAYLRQRKVLVGERHTEYTLLSLTKRGVIVRDLTDNKGKFSADMGTSQEVRTGDLVMCLFDVPETPRTVGLSKHDGMITGAYTVFDVQDKQAAHWLELFYLAMDDRKALSPLYSGLRNTIQKPRFLGTKTPIPPLPEQAAIVRYLDHVDRRVRRLVRAKRKLIALLTEQKQAIIHRAVTRGLDPDVPLKDSGVEWLGEVPEHWEVRKLRSQFRRCGSGTTPAGDHYYGGGVQWVMTGDLNDGEITTTKRTVTHTAVESVSALRMFPVGSLLIAMYGATIGKTGVLTSEACTNQACCVLADINRTSHVAFFQHLVVTARPNLIEQSYGGGQPNINAEIVRSLKMPIPPASEQAAIVEYLDQATAAIDTTITRAEREIELLNEYRIRLIADVVTGKLDVRDAAAALPEVDPLTESGDADDLESDLDMDAGELDETPEEVEA